VTATPALTNDIFGKYQKKISDALYLDLKESEYILRELQTFALELGSVMDRSVGYATDHDPGDENE
jgi:hypothetical protein